MIVPNRLAQAIKELGNKKADSFEVPEKIQEQGSKNHYHCIGVRSSDTKDSFDKVYSCKVLVCGINQWRKMQRQIKAKVFAIPFGDVYNRIIILHNPTLAPAKVKELSDKQKTKVDGLMEEGKGIDDEGLRLIAKEVGASFERVNAYIKSH
jgi:hypothetical protein